MENAVIELIGLTKKYGDFTAVDNLSLQIRKGEIFGLLGPNGAGKSTTILTILGLTEPSSGLVKVSGINSTQQPVEVKRKVGYLPEDVGFYDNRTGFENLMLTARLNRIPENEAIATVNQLLEKVGLVDAARKKTGTYSRGMRQRLGLADVLLKDPEIIVLDEPTSGIDPAGVREFLDLIVELSREKGLTVLFSSHNLHQVQKVCDRVGIFISGKLLGVGDIPSLSKKLFGNQSFVLEAKLSKANSAASNISVEELKKILAPLTQIEQISLVNDVFSIESECDMSAEIARFLINNAIDIRYLQQKEFGLDEIYYKYFEGKN